MQDARRSLYRLPTNRREDRIVVRGNMCERLEDVQTCVTSASAPEAVRACFAD